MCLLKKVTSHNQNRLSPTSSLSNSRDDDQKHDHGNRPQKRSSMNCAPHHSPSSIIIIITDIMIGSTSIPMFIVMFMLMMSFFVGSVNCVSSNQSLKTSASPSSPGIMIVVPPTVTDGFKNHSKNGSRMEFWNQSNTR